VTRKGAGEGGAEEFGPLGGNAPNIATGKADAIVRAMKSRTGWVGWPAVRYAGLESTKVAGAEE
jgi:hypothetical protein